jgi:serine/threonine protein kinase
VVHSFIFQDTIDMGPVKLSDFGFAKKIEKKNGCRTLCGTPGYLAPEILERWPAYDVKCDSWSFGVILFLLLGGYLPFDAQGSGDVNQVFERTRNGQYHFYPEKWENISTLAKDLVAKCLTVNPNKRIGTKAALAHEWMAEEELKLPATRLSCVSLANTVKTMEKAKKRKEKMKHPIQQVSIRLVINTRV